MGYFRLVANGIFDSTFTAVDSANGDCASGFTASGGLNACSFGNTATTSYFGRFIPNNFSITVGSITPSCGGSFSYFGQDGFSTNFTLTARNTANTITQNYTGGFAKLGVNNWSNYNFTAFSLPSGALLSASATTPMGSWNNGTASVSAKHLISRPSTAVAPTSITINAAPTDSDGVTMTSAAASPSSAFRYGRISLTNAYGSELLPLSMPIEAQYWNGTAYQRNQLDSCSTISASSIAMNNFRNNLAACETQLSGVGSMVAGKSTFNLSKPGAGNNGSVGLTLNLNGASGNSCISAISSAATFANLPWFGSVNSSARATFGIFKTPVIYLRENF